MSNPLYILAQTSIGNVEGIGNFVPTEAGGNMDSFFQIESAFSMVIGFFTIVGGLSLLIYFIVGALNWITAGGDAKKVDTAKSYMTNAAIGMIVMVSAYAIMFIIGKVLGIDFLNFACQINKIVYLDGGGCADPSTPLTLP